MVKGFLKMDKACALAFRLSRENPEQAIRVAIRLDGDKNTKSILIIDDDKDALSVLAGGQFLWVCYLNGKEVPDPRFSAEVLEVS